MPSTTARPATVLVSGVIVLSALMVGAPPALAAPRVVPMPGERFITPAERAAVRAAMTRGEARAIGHAFADDAPDLVVGYAKRGYSVLEDDDGSHRLVPVGRVTSDAFAAISLPAERSLADQMWLISTRSPQLPQ